MDQCHDCGEVVCRGCGSLLSCKFCGSALCEECATACAKCGIVLCGRDAKFAVECDTCRLSYCLVCLASGQKETCIRCHHRPSKRMEQLVHLRLKSIYKAFQQSARTNDAHPHLKRAALAAVKQPPKIDPIVAKAQADAAAAELLAELEQEEEEAAFQNNNNKSTSKSKRKRRKKKKGDASGGNHPTTTDKSTQQNDEQEQQQQQPHKQQHAEENDTKQGSDAATGNPKEEPSTCDQTDVQKPTKNDQDNKQDQKEAALSKEATLQAEKKTEPDPMLTKLCDLVNSSDIQGIEHLLEEWKGVPGKALLRKNAKKALKRLKAEKAVQQQQQPAPQELLKIVSTNPKTASTFEVVMEMSPSIVGWVIGKGGQKIRDLMDESGAKVWIDQESMAPQEPRIVYVSGAKKAVDSAVQRIEESVRQTGKTHAGGASSSPQRQQRQQQQQQEAGVMENPQDNTSGALRENGGGLVESLVTRELTCAPRFVPLLIGKRGWTIKNIQDESGAKVDIDQTVLPRLITITGTPEAVKTAGKLVGDVLSYPQTQLKNDHVGGEDFYQSADRMHGCDRSDVHSPPPSSLIMTGDIKSVISASSSLSSTPEPSMASSKSRGEYHMIPPPGLYDAAGRGHPELLGQPQRYNHQGYGKPPPYQQQLYSGNRQPPMGMMRPAAANQMPPNQSQGMMPQGGMMPQSHQLGGVGYGRAGHQQQQQQQQHFVGMNPQMNCPPMPPPQQQQQTHHQQMPMHQRPPGMVQNGHAPQQGVFGLFQPQPMRRPLFNQAEVGGHAFGQEAPSLLFGGGPELLPPKPCQPVPGDHDVIADLGLCALSPAFPSDGLLASQHSESDVPKEEESNLVDSLFGPSRSDAEAALLSGMNSLSIGAAKAEGSSCGAWWDNAGAKQKESRLPQMQQLQQTPTESRFPWES